MPACLRQVSPQSLQPTAATTPPHRHPCRVFPAAAGGPVAALRDDTKLVLYVGASAKPDILLFSAAGAPLGRVLWEGRARVLAAGWTSGEQLLVVDDAAQVQWVVRCMGGWTGGRGVGGLGEVGAVLAATGLSRC